VRQGLKLPLEKEQDMEVVAEAGDGLTTVALVRKFSPDLVIMDVNLPNLNGIEVTLKFIKVCAHHRILKNSRDDLIIRTGRRCRKRGYPNL